MTPAEPQPPDPRAGRPSKAELERIFGTEPTSTRDDLPDQEVRRAEDSWYLENRPPHHGG